MSAMLSADQALKIILENTPLLPEEKTLSASAVGRILSQDITSPLNLPPFDNSAMDGFALRADDVVRASVENPISLHVIKRVVAGDVENHCVMPLAHGQAVRIMTGAPVPEGADSVVPFEDVEDSTSETACVLRESVRTGQHIRKAGEDVREGESVFSQGECVTVPKIALMQALGLSHIWTARKPRIRILSTGNEIIPVGESLQKGQIYNSNGPTLVAALTELGCEVESLSVAVDTEEDLKKILGEAHEYDVLITIGGVSAGDLDLVPKVLTDLGAEEIFHKIAIKPGKPLLFCRWGKRLVFGLPGNPVSSLVVFQRFVRPALLKMQGACEIFQQRYQARLTSDLRGSRSKEDYLRGIVTYEEGGFQACSAGAQGSAHLKSLAASNALIILPPETDFLSSGDSVEFVFWEGK